MTDRTDILDSLSFEPLTPTSFLDRAAAAHGDRVGVVDGDASWTYAQLYERCTRMAGVLAPVADGRPVAVLAPNTHVMLEANFGVPWAGVPLVAMNTRLAAAEVAYILTHSNAAVLVHDPSFDELVDDVFARLDSAPHRIRTDTEYEKMLAAADPLHRTPTDERSLLSINYTSGTTGRPKGVMYHHRGAHLQAVAMVGHTGLTPRSVHLWTLPMFHCNGWCFPWAVTAAAATHVCLPKVDPAEIWRLIRERRCHTPERCTHGAVDDRVREASNAGRGGSGARGDGWRAAVAGDPAPNVGVGVRRHAPVRADRDLRAGDAV